MQFERAQDIKKSLSLGGYSFDTLRPGAIIVVTRKFGISDAKGKIRNINSCYLKLEKDSHLLITRISNICDPKRKEIHFIKHPSMNYFIGQDRETLRKGHAFTGWRRTGHFGNMSKRMFDYRLKVLEPGF